MNVEKVRERVEAIKHITDDDESAHCMEDELREDVLEAIVQGAPNPGELAAEALKTGGIEFARRCA